MVSKGPEKVNIRKHLNLIKKWYISKITCDKGINKHNAYWTKFHRRINMVQLFYSYFVGLIEKKNCFIGVIYATTQYIAVVILKLTFTCYRMVKEIACISIQIDRYTNRKFFLHLDLHACYTLHFQYLFVG